MAQQGCVKIDVIIVHYVDSDWCNPIASSSMTGKIACVLIDNLSREYLVPSHCLSADCAACNNVAVDFSKWSSLTCLMLEAFLTPLEIVSRVYFKLDRGVGANKTKRNLWGGGGAA